MLQKLKLLPVLECLYYDLETANEVSLREVLNPNEFFNLVFILLKWIQNLFYVYEPIVLHVIETSLSEHHITVWWCLNDQHLPYKASNGRLMEQNEENLPIFLTVSARTTVIWDISQSLSLCISWTKIHSRMQTSPTSLQCSKSSGNFFSPSVTMFHPLPQILHCPVACVFMFKGTTPLTAMACS